MRNLIIYGEYLVVLGLLCFLSLATGCHIGKGRVSVTSAYSATNSVLNAGILLTDQNRSTLICDIIDSKGTVVGEFYLEMRGLMFSTVRPEIQTAHALFYDLKVSNTDIAFGRTCLVDIWIHPNINTLAFEHAGFEGMVDLTTGKGCIRYPPLTPSGDVGRWFLLRYRAYPKDLW